MRKTLHGYSVRNYHACLGQELKHSFIHSNMRLKRLSSKGSQLLFGTHCTAVNYLKSSLARLELVIHHTVSEYCVMNL